MSDAPRQPFVERLTQHLLTAILDHPDFEELQIREIISAVASLLITLIVHVGSKYVGDTGRPAYRALMAAELHQMADGVEAGFYERDEAPTPLVH